MGARSSGRSEAASDAEALGLPGEMIEEIAEAEAADGQDDECEVWPENWDIVMAFAAVRTQWRVAIDQMGRQHFTGLDYAGVRAGLHALRIRLSPEQFGGLQTMEVEAIAATAAAQSAR